MTPFESLLWNVWLPKVRSCLNNDWSPQEPQAAVKLYEAWSTFLPPFIRDNVLDQLILPKVHEAVSDWNPRKDTVSLQSLVFPWLPHLGLRLEDVLGDARRKVKGLLRGWGAGDGVPEDLAVWKDVCTLTVDTEMMAHIYFLSRFSMRWTGTQCSSNISCPNWGRSCATISALILANRIWNRYSKFFHGQQLSDRQSSPSLSKPSFSPSGSTFCTSGSYSPKSASKRWRSGISSGRIRFQRMCRQCLA